MTRIAYQLRDADTDDFQWALALAEESSMFTVSPLRGVTGELARAFVQQSVKELQLQARLGSVRFLIAVDPNNDERVGYLILNLAHEGPAEQPQGFIEDMAVIPDYLGRHVGHFLTDEAARITGEAGLAFLGAEVSCTNLRALLAAMGNGFELEAYRIVRPCNDEAKAAVDNVEAALDNLEQAQQRRRLVLNRRLKRRRRRQRRGR